MDDGRAGPGGHRLYQELAKWWPLISPPGEYAADAGRVAGEFGRAARPVREVLELGCGGGHGASHLRAHYDMTLADASGPMLEQSRRLNPGCDHVRGDMRTLRLGRDFDAVLVHDAVDYMTTEADLASVVAAAYGHCRPGGVAVFLPGHTSETYQPGTGYGGSDGPDGRGVRYLEWSWDPDPGDTWTLTEYAFLLRSADGSVRNLHETHRLGLFRRGTWLRLLAAAGFSPATRTEPATRDFPASDLFAGHRPAA